MEFTRLEALWHISRLMPQISPGNRPESYLMRINFSTSQLQLPLRLIREHIVSISAQSDDFIMQNKQSVLVVVIVDAVPNFTQSC